MTFAKTQNLGLNSDYKSFWGSKPVENAPILLKIEKLSSLNAQFRQKSTKTDFKDNPLLKY